MKALMDVFSIANTTAILTGIELVRRHPEYAVALSRQAEELSPDAMQLVGAATEDLVRGLPIEVLS